MNTSNQNLTAPVANGGQSKTKVIHAETERQRAGKTLAGTSWERMVAYLVSVTHPTRDVSERLNIFADTEPGGDDEIDVRRLALNMPQVRRFNPPENPAKLTDTRANAYVERFGNSSWELDALEPRILAGLVRAAVAEVIDAEKMEAAKARQEEMRRELTAFADQYGEDE